MDLDLARDWLQSHLRAPVPVDGRRSDITAHVWNWFNAYKMWEANDTFLKAFKQKRLCITQRPDEDNVTDTLKTQYAMSALGSTVAKSPKIDVPGVTYTVGVESLATRMNPANYSGVNEQGIKHKYALGLFDLSASLLNPEFDTIKGQLRWSLTGPKALWRIVFIPLPKPQDVAMFDELNRFAKATKDPILLGIVKFIRHRMTRPKLAAAEDMGAGPYVWTPKDSVQKKIKYGFKSDEGVATDQTQHRVDTARQDYQKIIEAPKKILGRGEDKVVASNELTIALRQRDGKRFPIITQFDEGNNRFNFVGRNDYFRQPFIPDHWKGTQEIRQV